MSYEMRLLADDSILLTTFHADFSVAAEAPQLMAEMKQVLDAAPGPLTMLDDLLSLKMSFGDMVSGLAMATRGDFAMARHPNVRKLVIVSTNDLLRLGGNALKQAQYGGVQTDIYPTLEEAINGIRGELAGV